jgi:adenine-specific DNA methylase
MSNRKRNKICSYAATEAELREIEQAIKITQHKSRTDFILSLIRNSNTIVVSEVKSYDEIFNRAGNVGNQILRALNTILSNDIQDAKKNDVLRKLEVFLEKDNRHILNVLVRLAENLDSAVDVYSNYEENIELATSKKLAQVIKQKRKEAGGI